MIEMVEANWLAFVLALLIGVLVAWWVFRQGSTVEKPRERRPDVLDEGAEPAKRNQALIDSPPAATIMAAPGSGIMAGMGEVIAVAAQDEVESSSAREQQEQEEKEPERVKEAEAPADPAPTAPPVAAPAAPPAAPAAAPATDVGSDDLRKLKGVGPKLVALLHSLGVTRYEQIAAWTDEDIDRMDTQLGSFAGRIRRDNWVEQARYLAAGDAAGYEARFGKL